MAPARRSPTIEVHLGPGDLRTAMERDVLAGLGGSPKQLPPVYFYDERGSRLFDEITRLTEYYPTRAERWILEHHAKDIVELAGADTVVELGAGTCDKSRILLDALVASGRPGRFVPLDVSEEVLWEAACAVAEDYPGIDVHAVVADFHDHLEVVAGAADRGLYGGTRRPRRLFAFLGGTIGNLDPTARRRFLCDLDCAMRAGDRLLLGTDLVKAADRLEAAYDDAAGVTAEFNRNVLHVLNRELGATFDPGEFEHVARWDAERSRVEMRLRAPRDLAVHVRDLDLDVAFRAGEDILTEISCKFTPDGLAAELVACGFVVCGSWTPPGEEFLLTLARPYC